MREGGREKEGSSEEGTFTCLGLAFFLHSFVRTPSPTNTLPGFARGCMCEGGRREGGEGGGHKSSQDSKS